MYDMQPHMDIAQPGQYVHSSRFSPFPYRTEDFELTWELCSAYLQINTVNKIRNILLGIRQIKKILGNNLLTELKAPSGLVLEYTWHIVCISIEVYER